MKFTIFTGTTDGERFFDSFVNDEGFGSEYDDDTRFDFTLDESEIETRIKDLLADEECFKTCCSGLTRNDYCKFVFHSFHDETDWELISDHVQKNARKMVIDLWEQDCLIGVKLKFKGDK